jgi:hypothetical protein
MKKQLRDDDIRLIPQLFILTKSIFEALEFHVYSISTNENKRGGKMDKTSLQMRVVIGSKEEENLDSLETMSKDLLESLNEIDDVKWILLRDENLPTDSKGTSLEWSPILLLLLSQSPQIWGVINAFFAWLMRDKSRSLELTIGENSLKVSGTSKEEQQKLIDWFKIQSGMRMDK